MNEEIDDSEFYHQDFTTASEWEIFIARMEEIILQWKQQDQRNESLQIDDLSHWEIRAEPVTYIDMNLELLFYRKNGNEDKSDSSNEKSSKHPINMDHDFELYDEKQIEDHSCIYKWYSVKEFIILSPIGGVGITSESKIKLLLSSASVVASNLHCGIPMFVQIREKWQHLYLGVFDEIDFRVNFEMIHLRKSLPYYRHLSGLLDMFKNKIKSPFRIEDIIISHQSNYLLNNFGNFVWKQDTSSGISDVENFFILPFGVTVDPISGIIVKTTWRNLIENTHFDTENRTMFLPQGARAWSCMAQMTNDPMCLLADGLTEFGQILNNTSNVYDVLGDFVIMATSDNNPLDLLTEPTVPTISTLLTRAARNSLAKNKKSTPPINENIFVPLLYFLFPDADESACYPYGQDKDLHQKNVKEMLKTCPVDSLIWRLSTILMHSLQSLGGVKALAHIWYEFVQEMRYRWEKSMPIPGLSLGYPDLRTCLLQQKLQMLNCCIQRKISRENSQSTHNDSADSSENSDDEFFDCDDEDQEKKLKYSLWNQPVGRLSKFGDMKLLKTGDPLFIPITQEPVLKTEDQLEEDTDVLLKLGSDQEASELRARIMSASLLSDMESFKAANPGSLVEDFIRWYSPRDWIEEDELDEFGQKKGHLSARMVLDDNIWVQMWKSAKPVPAHRQKRLFDDTREAEKVLQFLDFRTIGQIAELIIPVLSHTTVYRLMDEVENCASEITESQLRITSLLKHVEKISRDRNLQFKRFEAFTQEVNTLELIISQIHSLHYKLNPLGTGDTEIGELIGQIVDGKEVEIPNKEQSLIGSRILSMFAEVKRANQPASTESVSPEKPRSEFSAFPEAFEREFVIRANAVKPALYSSSFPQYLRAIISKKEFRVAGAFTEDAAFF